MSLARTSLVFAALLAAAPVSVQSVMAQNAAQSAAQPAAKEEVSIPFAKFGGIDDWRADGNKAIYVKGRGNEWYYATLMSTCQGLNFATTIGFKNEPTGDFNRFSTIVVDGQACQLTSLVKSEKPAPKK